MIDAHRVGAGVAILVLFAGNPAARAEDSVPGGWSPRVAYQSFGLPAEPGPTGFMGFGPGPAFLGSPLVPYATGFPRVGVPMTAPFPRAQVVNGLEPLSDLFRKNSRKRPRR